MKKIDWKSKLTSRKFWAAIVSAAASIAVAFGAGDGTVAQITAIIMAGATVIAYIIGEGLVDASRNKASAENPESNAEGGAEQKKGSDGKTTDESHDTPSETASNTAENKQNSD